MKIHFFCPRWGFEHVPWENFLSKVKRAGYDGIEYGIANNTTSHELDHVWTLLNKLQLKVIPQHYETNDADFLKHVENYEKWIKMVVNYPCEKINLQTGKDYFSFEQNAQLIQLAKGYTDRSGIKIIHETHRGKFSFAAHVMREYFEKIEHLEITLDVSHWINVAESYLEDQMDVITLATSRTDHIHARVGYPEGPQVPDPRVPEWQEAFSRHLLFWDMVVDKKRSLNQDNTLTITPEFGAPPYMILLPRTNKPISNQWQVNKFMMQILKERYNKIEKGI